MRNDDHLGSVAVVNDSGAGGQLLLKLFGLLLFQDLFFSLVEELLEQNLNSNFDLLILPEG